MHIGNDPGGKLWKKKNTANHFIRIKDASITLVITTSRKRNSAAFSVIARFMRWETAAEEISVMIMKKE